jgi:transposase, IS5 family
VRADSYVLESNIHHPTDCNLLWDAARKSIELAAKLCAELGLPGLRKERYWKREVKSAMRKCERTASRGGANKAARLHRETAGYLARASALGGRVAAAVGAMLACPLNPVQHAKLLEIGYFQDMLDKHIDLVRRRLIGGESIPHHEKVFSLFEPHTELVKKGKSRPPVEFGHRLLIATARGGFAIDYKVMEGGSESSEIVPLAERLVARFGAGSIASLSTDEGFSSAENHQRLSELVDRVVMPKKGRGTQADREREESPGWKRLKDRHSAVESDINALEHHGLDRCPDRGIDGFKRYAGYGVLAYNLHKIGAHLLAVERRKCGATRRARAA